MRPSPLQNRVQPDGAILATGTRGLFMGNRGILHDDRYRLGTARWRHKAWICCVLEFKNRHRQVMRPGNYTELFFLDEAVALAAGHRPCAECRRADYNRFRAAWGGLPSAPQMDATLHPARVTRTRAKVTFGADPADLPTGTMIRRDGRFWLIQSGGARAFAPSGYGPLVASPAGPVDVLTPAPIVAVLAAGYRPALHDSARA